MRKALIAALAALTALAVVTLAPATSSGRKAAMAPTQYVVVYEHGVSQAAGRAAVRAIGGRIVRENAKVGVATVVSRNPDFVIEAVRSAKLVGAAVNRPLGRVPDMVPKRGVDYPNLRNLAKGKQLRQRFRYADANSAAEPLAGHQWDMRMINATPAGSYKRERGDRKVLVGIADTGVDGTHPDIAPNFSNSLSRNFTVDSPDVDGPCAAEADASCNDPANVDENLHGTHVASTVGSPINGIGIAGVAPNVTIVNIRAGQDSGFFFLQPSVDALTYAGDVGIDVVNMSYFIDPWLYNCRGLADDSPAEQAQQATVLEAAQRALDYAHQRGVTLVGAAGNGLTDLTMPKPVVDTQSPNYPLGTNHPRTVNNGCLDLPTEGNNVISVSSVGPSKTKADYSNYGYGEIDVAAPGGWFRDDPLWKATDPAAVRNIVAIPNQILAALPKNIADENHLLNPDGTPNTPSVVRSCKGSTCGYYIWIQGTSMAAPHATGVAALIVSKYGDKRSGGITLDPHFTRAYLQSSAAETPCMTPNPFTYTHKLRPAAYTTWCEGTSTYNGVYGHGIVDALNAVSFRHGGDDD